jgi:hypothetical protein
MVAGFYHHQPASVVAPLRLCLNITNQKICFTQSREAEGAKHLEAFLV